MRLDSILFLPLARIRAWCPGSSVFPWDGEPPNRMPAPRSQWMLISGDLILDLFRIGCIVSFGDPMSDFVGDPVGDAQKSGEKP